MPRSTPMTISVTKLGRGFSSWAESWARTLTNGCWNVTSSTWLWLTATVWVGKQRRSRPLQPVAIPSGARSSSDSYKISVSTLVTRRPAFWPLTCTARQSVPYVLVQFPDVFRVRCQGNAIPLSFKSVICRRSTSAYKSPLSSRASIMHRSIRIQRSSPVAWVALK